MMKPYRVTLQSSDGRNTDHTVYALSVADAKITAPYRFAGEIVGVNEAGAR